MHIVSDVTLLGTSTSKETKGNVYDFDILVPGHELIHLRVTSEDEWKFWNKLIRIARAARVSSADYQYDGENTYINNEDEDYSKSLNEVRGRTGSRKSLASPGQSGSAAASPRDRGRTESSVASRASRSRSATSTRASSTSRPSSRSRPSSTSSSPQASPRDRGSSSIGQPYESSMKSRSQSRTRFSNDSAQGVSPSAIMDALNDVNGMDDEAPRKSSVSPKGPQHLRSPSKPPMSIYSDIETTPGTAIGSNMCFSSDNENGGTFFDEVMCFFRVPQTFSK